jgi:hypothetical protein
MRWLHFSSTIYIMSSSDYTQFKKTGVILKNLVDEPYVLDDSEYTAFMNYNLENTVTNSKIVYNKLNQPNHQMVFNMDRMNTNCPTFALCRQTNTRPNRKNILRTQAAPRPRVKYIKDRMLYNDKFKILCLDKGTNGAKCTLCTKALCCGCKPVSTTTNPGCKSFA